MEPLGPLPVVTRVKSNVFECLNELRKRRPENPTGPVQAHFNIMFKCLLAVFGGLGTMSEVLLQPEVWAGLIKEWQLAEVGKHLTEAEPASQDLAVTIVELPARGGVELWFAAQRKTEDLRQKMADIIREFHAIFAEATERDLERVKPVLEDRKAGHEGTETECKDQLMPALPMGSRFAAIWEEMRRRALNLLDAIE